jgi:hypothetical protein
LLYFIFGKQTEKSAFVSATAQTKILAGFLRITDRKTLIILEDDWCLFLLFKV